MIAMQKHRSDRAVQTPARRSRLDLDAAQQDELLSYQKIELESEFSYVPPEFANLAPSAGEVASVIQIWECTVLEVDEQTIRSQLHAKMGAVDDHVADIDLEWVSPQDLDLVQPGAVFYLTLSRKLTRSRSIVNSQELRFRRLPAWNRQDSKKIRQIGADLFAKLSAPATLA